jgi:hypothetical protein
MSDLVLVSSNLTEQNTAPNFFYQEWFGEVENVGPKLYCFVNIGISISPGPGLPLALKAYVETMPYLSPGLTLTTPCIAPGTTGAMWANNISQVSANLGTATTFAYQLAGMDGDGEVPHPDTPAIADAFDAASRVVSGSMVAVGTISNIGFASYVRGASGLIVDRLIDTNLGVLAAGASWSFSTNPTTDTVVGHVDTVNFIDGVGLGGAPVPHVRGAGAVPRANRVWEAEEERRGLAEERAFRRSVQRGRAARREGVGPL